MKKYKVIKEFPSPSTMKQYKLGDIISEIGYKGMCDVAEYYPEYFEEIKDEYPKIIAFRNSLGDIYERKENHFFLKDRCNVSVEEYFLLQFHEIYQVLTLNDIIFTIGEKVKIINNNHYECIIERFKIIDGSIFCVLNSHNNVQEQPIYCIEKIKCPLYITKDNIEIFNENDLVYKVNLKTLSKTYTHYTHAKFHNNEIIFKHEINADKYIKENKLRYSITDINNILLKMGINSNSYFGCEFNNHLNNYLKNHLKN